MMISEDYEGWMEKCTPPMTATNNQASGFNDEYFSHGNLSLTTSDTSDESDQSMFSRLKKRGFFAAAQKHPTPTTLNFARSADC
jgi:hypothetical protein